MSTPLIYSRPPLELDNAAMSDWTEPCSVQADNEPICIDSDEDDHAAGSAPARESDQNGAGPALRRSERSNAMKTTTQIFKVRSTNRC